MARGPRTPEGIAAVTRTIERVNAERRRVRHRSARAQDIYAIEPLQPKVRALAAQIIALLEGAGRGIIRPTDRVLIELLATALALTLTRLRQAEDLAAASPALSAVGSRSPGVQETGKAAKVRAGEFDGRGKVAASLPDAPPGPAGRAGNS